MEKELSAAGGELIRMPLDSKAPHKILRNAPRLAALIRRRGVGLVHARSRAPAWSAFFAARHTGVPLITTYHGIYNAAHPLKRFYNSVMVRSDAVIANSEWTAAHIAKEHRLPRARITVIPRGVDLEEFDPAGVTPERIQRLQNMWGIEPGNTTILLPARMTRWKGQLVLVEALARLAARDQLGALRAAFVGDAQGREQYVHEVKAAITRAHLDEVITIAGHVSDMAAAYLASDIVVSASTDPEAFGRVVAEAGAMGRPVIASDHGGAREIVIPHESGLLVPPGDAAALTDALRGLIEMGAGARTNMGERGRKHVRENFSVQKMCADTLAVYCRLLGR